MTQAAVQDGWMAAAACRGRTSLFFPPPNERPSERKRREAMARRICLACPVMETCRAWARERSEYGFWGGESEEERVGSGHYVQFPTGRVAHAGRQHRRMQLLADSVASAGS